jgi:hypothetical protein
MVFNPRDRLADALLGKSTFLQADLNPSWIVGASSWSTSTSGQINAAIRAT